MAMYYYECPKCGASLDPGEPCEDCMEKEKKLQETKNRIERLTKPDIHGQMRLDFCG